MEDAGFLQELCNIVKQNSDDYDAVIAEKASYPYLYHLSDIRKNLVDWLPITEDMRVLEVHPECGVLTEALLTMAGHVTCIAEDDAASRRSLRRDVGARLLSRRMTGGGSPSLNMTWF